MIQPDLDKIVGNRFVNRLAELNLVQDILGDVSHGRDTLKRVVNFHGVRGIGKTWLLLHLLAQEPRGRSMWVDLSSFGEQRSPEQLKAGIAQSITGQVAALRPTSEPIQHEPMFPPNQDVSLSFLPGDLLSQLAPDVALLLFDATEQVDSKVLEWLEREVIGPLLQTNKIVVVLAGRKPINWQKFDINRRVIPHQLEPFDQGTIGFQLPSYASLASQIASLTFGHPLANEQLAQNLRNVEQAENIEVDPIYFEQHKKQLLQYLFDQLIDREIMAGIDTDVRQAIGVISVLRQFDINALRYLLNLSEPAEFKDKPGVYFLDLISRMVDCGLVRWDSQQKGYALDKSIRRMLFLHKYHAETASFVEMNQAAADLYALWIEKLPEHRIRSIVERLFHIGNQMAAQGKEPAEIAFQLSSELQGYLEKYYRSAEFGLGNVMTLREELRADIEFWETVPLDRQRLDKIISDSMYVREEG